jgi:dihydrolipoamide dehydrogenase
MPKENTLQHESTKSDDSASRHAELVVIGSGPGGYTAAFRGADLGMKTMLVERHSVLGGVCLNVGCIPSKALLHAAVSIRQAKAMEAAGVRFGSPDIDIDALRAWKNKVVSRLTGGIRSLAKRRNVEVVQGTASFISPHKLAVRREDTTLQEITFDRLILALGSRPQMLPGVTTEHRRVMDSTNALELPEIPQSLLVVGAGIIGLEMATVYRALGTRITVVELTDQILPGVDRDLAEVLQRQFKKESEALYMSTKITAVRPDASGVEVEFEGEKSPAQKRFERVLIAIGRRPNGDRMEANKAGVEIDEQGFIPVDGQMRTNVSHIFAIGDVVGQPMLAHKATYEGKLAAEAAAGSSRVWDTRAIPVVIYTDPEAAWVGLTESEARQRGKTYEKAVFPWGANGRNIASNRTDGLTKLLFEPDTKHTIGAGIVGPAAGDLIAECALAIEMGADAEDLALTIHPHPTFAETITMAAERLEGTITDL